MTVVEMGTETIPNVLRIHNSHVEQKELSGG